MINHDIRAYTFALRSLEVNTVIARRKAIPTAMIATTAIIVAIRNRTGGIIWSPMASANSSASSHQQIVTTGDPRGVPMTDTNPASYK